MLNIHMLEVSCEAQNPITFIVSEHTPNSTSSRLDPNTRIRVEFVGTLVRRFPFKVDDGVRFYRSTMVHNSKGIFVGLGYSLFNKDIIISFVEQVMISVEPNIPHTKR